MSIDHNRIKVADLEKDLPNKILITNTEGELAFDDIDNLTLDFQQVTDNGYVTENPFYRWYDYGEGRAVLGVVNFPETGFPDGGLPIVGVRTCTYDKEETDSFVLGFTGDNGYGELPAIAFRTDNYASYPDRNLRFEFPLKDNPNYPQPNIYTLATTDDLTNLNLDFQQVTDNGFVTDNSFYKEHDYGEGRALLGVVDSIVGVKEGVSNSEEDPSRFTLGFGAHHYNSDELPNIVFTTNNYGTFPDKNLRFEFPIDKENPSYPSGDTYILATDDSVVHKTGEVDEVIDGFKTFRFPTTFRGDASASYVTVRSSDITFTTDANDNNSVKLKAQKISGAENENFTQTLQAKEGTIALLDDITLQKVMDNGAYADVDEGHSNLSLLSGSENDRNIFLVVGNGTEESQYFQNNNNIVLEANVNNSGSLLSVSASEGVSIFHRDLDNSTTFKLGAPASTSTFSLPSKSADGDYILATTEDLEDLSETVYTKAEVDTKFLDKVDKITGKGLSTNDYTTAEKAKVTAIDQAVSTAEKAVWNAGDMSTNTNQTVSGIKTFLSGMFGLRNVANTFTSFFTNANTASRTYTLQNRNGTLADLADIAAVNTGKMNTPSGSANYLSKFLTATTIGISRLWDDGTYFGIGTANSPLKDLTLGNQASREIGVEESDNTNIGRDLTLTAGRAINYVPNSDFNAFQNLQSGNNLNQIATSNTTGAVYLQIFGWNTYRKQINDLLFGSIGTPYTWTSGIAITPSGDLYRCNNSSIWKNGSLLTATPTSSYSRMASSNNGNVYIYSGAIYEQTGGIGTFNFLQSNGFTDVCGHPSNNDVYAVGGGYLWKQTNGTGLFVNTSVAAPGELLTITPNNNFYIAKSSTAGDIYKQTNGSGTFIGLGQTFRTYNALGYSLNNNVYAYSNTSSDIYLQINDVGGAADLQGGTLKLKAGTGKGTGQSKLEFYTGQKTVSGTNMQAETLRMQIDENGILKRIGTPVYADNTAALAGGLTAGMEYRTSTGIKMEVY